MKECSVQWAPLCQPWGAKMAIRAPGCGLELLLRLLEGGHQGGSGHCSILWGPRASLLPAGCSASETLAWGEGSGAAAGAPLVREG